MPRGKGTQLWPQLGLFLVKALHGKYSQGRALDVGGVVVRLNSNCIRVLSILLVKVDIGRSEGLGIAVIRAQALEFAQGC